MPNKYLPLLLLFVSLASQGETLFKWVDDNGATHYAEAPPDNQKSKEVDITPPKPTDDDPKITHYVVGLPASQNQTDQSFSTHAESKKSASSTAVTTWQLRDREYKMHHTNQKATEHRQELKRATANRQSARVVSPSKGNSHTAPHSSPSHHSSGR